MILDNCIGFDIKVWDPSTRLVTTSNGVSLSAAGDRVPNGKGMSCQLHRRAVPS